MKAEDRKQLEANSLVRGLRTLVARAKSGKLVSPWVLAILLAVVAGGGIWFYLAYSGDKLVSQAWVEFANSSSSSDLQNLIEVHKDGTPTKVARLEMARNLLGKEGIARLAIRSPSDRKQGIENIEKAREELTKLADEFKGDPTMRATCLLAVAEAELALVGIPKDASSPDFRGSVDRVIELYREVATLAGDNTAAAESFRKRADELEAQKDKIREVGVALNSMLAPPPSFSFPEPGVGPKPPLGPITPPTPPDGEGPKPPTSPVKPPDGAGTSTVPTKPSTPPQPPPGTVPTKK